MDREAGLRTLEPLVAYISMTWGRGISGYQQRQADFPVIVKVRVEPDRPGPRRPELHLQQQQTQHFGLEGRRADLGRNTGIAGSFYREQDVELVDPTSVGSICGPEGREDIITTARHTAGGHTR